MIMTANQTVITGSVKNGFMEIKLGEKVKVIKQTEKTVYVEKDGIVKMFNKNIFSN